MEIAKLNGKYVVAVSGGVDSVVLLDLLNTQKLESDELELVVAHFDHGIRNESAEDRKLVEDITSKYGLKFYYSEGKLGKDVSEQKARDARYEFLNKVVIQEKAKALITAHHQDDLIETAILNIIRGTGRKGLTSLSSTAQLIRPLLNYSKLEIIKYAKDNKLKWHEDSTNEQDKYLRNYIRHNIVPRLDQNSKDHFLKIISKQKELNDEIDIELEDVLNSNIKEDKIPRLWLNSLDTRLSREVLAAWLRKNKLAEFDKTTIERLSSDLKIIKPNKRIDIYNNWYVRSTRDDLALEHVER
jgi:tRNA(Ile)-lysidine synthase